MRERKKEKAENENYHNKMMKLKSLDIRASCKQVFRHFYTMEYPDLSF